MLNTLGATRVQRLLMATELLQLGEEGEDLPLSGLLRKTNETLSAAQRCLKVHKELDTRDLTLWIKWCQLGCLDTRCLVQCELPESETITRRCALSKKIEDGSWGVGSPELPGQR